MKVDFYVSKAFWIKDELNLSYIVILKNYVSCLNKFRRTLLNLISKHCLKLRTVRTGSLTVGRKDIHLNRVRFCKVKRHFCRVSVVFYISDF